MLRQSFAKELETVGLERGAELRRDREYTLEKVAKGIEGLRENQTWYQNFLNKGSDKAFDGFAYRSRAISKTNFLLGALKCEEKYISAFELSSQHSVSKMGHEIKKFRKRLTTVKPKELAQEKQNLAEKLKKDSEFISRKIKHIDSFDFDSMSVAIKNKTEANMKASSTFLDQHMDQLQDAYIKLNRKEYEPYFKNLFEKATTNQTLLQALSKSMKLKKDRNHGLDYKSGDF